MHSFDNLLLANVRNSSPEVEFKSMGNVTAHGRVEILDSIPSQSGYDRRMSAVNEDGDLPCGHVFFDIFLSEELLFHIERSGRNGGNHFEFR